MACPRVPAHQGPDGRPQRRSTGSSGAGGYVSINVGSAAGRQRHPDRQATSPTRRWTRRSASGAARASPRARTRRPRSSRRRRSPTWGCCRRAGPSGSPRHPHGGAHGRRGLRQLLERRRVRSGVPEGDLDCRHRAHEPRLPARHADASARSPRRADSADSLRRRTRHPRRGTELTQEQEDGPRGLGRAALVLCRSRPRLRQAQPSRLHYTLTMFTSSCTAAADFFRAASSSAVSLISMICSTPPGTELHGHADEEVANAVFPLQEDRTRER